MALKWRGYPGSNHVRLTLLASRDKINRAPGDVCYDLLWYSCHSYIALSDKIMITLGTLGPLIRWPTSVKAKLFSSRQNYLSQGKTLFPKAKLSFLRQNFLSPGKPFFPKTKLSFSRQNYLSQDKTSLSRQNFLSQGKTFIPKTKLSFSRPSFLSHDKTLLGGNQKKPIQC